MKSICFLLLLMSTQVQSQDSEIRAVIDKMFASMVSADTAALRTCFIPGARLLTYSYDAAGNPRSSLDDLQEMIHAIGNMGPADFEEKLTGWQCLTDEGMASVWTPYEFYFEKKFSHCGVNQFQLINIHGQWKITQITDTRRRKNCIDESILVQQLDSMINLWHHAAAVADEVAFFGFMRKDGIYIGTDPTERWLRDELRTWSEKFFDRESAWKFTPVSRNISIGPGSHLAWFDEILDTWMGPCRSTGILVKEESQWKLVHYHLSMAIPNDAVDSYLKMLKD